jgi:hypothetical protein
MVVPRLERVFDGGKEAMTGLPGIVRPLAEYRGWGKKSDAKRSIEEKREVVVRGIQRSLRGEKGAASLERFDPVQGAHVVRVLYCSHPLPIFDGQKFAVIEADCDRAALWGAVVEQIRAGRFDREIEAVATKVCRSLEKTRHARKAA